MPLVRPEIQKILRSAGLEKEVPADEGTISDKLKSAGLDLDTTLENLSDLTRSGNESLRLNALKLVLQAHGALKESAPTPPSFTIIIQDSQKTPQIEGVNPILLPRQLLKELDKAN